MSIQIDEKTSSGSVFHIEEFKLLRTEIVADERELSRIQQTCATAAGAIWLWALSRATLPPLVLLLIPILVSVFGWLRWRTQLESIYSLADYIKRIENKYAEPSLRGWEHFLDDKREELKKKGMTIKQSGQLFWIILTVATVTFVLLFVPAYL